MYLIGKEALATDEEMLSVILCPRHLHYYVQLKGITAKYTLKYVAGSSCHGVAMELRRRKDESELVLLT